MDLPFRFIDVYVCLHARSTSLDYYSAAVSLETGRSSSPFFKIVLAVWGSPFPFLQAEAIEVLTEMARNLQLTLGGVAI